MPARAAFKIGRYVLLAAGGVALGLYACTTLPSPWSFVAASAWLSLCLAGAAFVLDMVAPGFDLLSRAIARWDAPQGSHVVLTFDDGPIEPSTREVLAVLDAYDVKATFFCIGHNARRHPDLVRDLAARGHDVANHSDTHALLPFRSAAGIRREIETASVTLEALTGRRPEWLRCPKGYKSRKVERIAAELGHTLIGFSFAAYDVQNPAPQKLAARVVDRARPGDILLLHDGHAPAKPGRRDSVVKALPAIVTGLRRRGLEPLSLSQAIEREPSLAKLLHGTATPHPSGAP